MGVYIETERLILREFTSSDTYGVYELDSDPEVHKFLGENPIRSLKQAQSIVENIKLQYLENGIGRWAIIDKTENEFIGWSGLKYEKEVKKDMPYYDLGYRLKKKYWGRGIATETSLLALDHGFNRLSLPEIFAGAHIENVGSNKVLQKVGLRFIETFEYDNLLHNWYGIGKSAWLKSINNASYG